MEGLLQEPREARKAYFAESCRNKFIGARYKAGSSMQARAPGSNLAEANGVRPEQTSELCRAANELWKIFRQ